MANDEKHTTTVVVTTPDHQNYKKTSRFTPQDTRGTASKVIVAILVVAAITALILWLVYRPHDPKFTVVDATIYNNAMQFTVVTRNPNNRVSIHYDRLVIFVSYNNQPITPPLLLPPLHHESDSTVAMSPILPVTPEVVNGLGNDEPVSLRLVLTGKLRWKAGGIRMRRKRVYVGCDVLVGLKRGVLGRVPLLGSSVCRVDI